MKYEYKGYILRLSGEMMKDLVRFGFKDEDEIKREFEKQIDNGKFRKDN
jgi:hypothetical protein